MSKPKQESSIDNVDAELPTLTKKSFELAKGLGEGNLVAIAEERLEEADDAVKKLKRRAKRLGITEFVVRAVFVFFVSVFDDRTRTFSDRRYTVARIDGPRPRINGWAFAGVIDSSDPAVEGFMIRMAPGFDAPAHARDCDPKLCEHCSTRRRRNETFLLQHEDGRWIQVGRTCLKDFLGNDPKAALLGMQFVPELEAFGGDEDDFGRIGSPWTLPTLRVFLIAVRRVMVTDGWVSASRARDLCDVQPTKSIAWGYCLPPAPNDHDHRKFWDSITDEDRQFADAAIAWLPTMFDKPTLSDFEFNLKAATGRGIVSSRTAGLAASVLACYERAMNLEVSRGIEAKRRAASRHVGTVGERLDLTVTVTTVKWLESDWGSKQLVKMVTDGGDIVTTFYSGGREFDREERLALRGTVKRHHEYNGTQETILTRISVGPVPAPKAEAPKADVAPKAEAKPVTVRKGTTADLVLQAVTDGPKTIAELVEFSGKSECAVRRYAGKLAKAGQLVKDGAVFVAA